MNLRKHVKKLIIGACLILVGTVIIFPVEAHVIGSRDAHTFSRKHAAYYSPRSWVKRYFATRSWVKRYFSTKTWVKNYFYTKSQSDTRYYTKSQSDSRYLLPSEALATYLTQANAASTYVSKSGDTMTGALTAPDYNYSSAKTKYLNIDAHGFATEGDMVVGDGSGYWVYKASGTGSKMRASISLPDGAVMTNMRLNYFRNDASNEVTAKLYLSGFSGGRNLLATASSPLGTDWPYYSYVDATPASYGATIDNGYQSYYVEINFGATGTTLGANSVVITYTVNEP